MTADELKAVQTPIKERYRNDPDAAVHVMVAEGQISGDQTCRLATPAGDVDAGLHPAAGGSGDWACSGDMLLQSLIACAGVTFSAVATAMGIPVDEATVRAEGELDFRGTLGVSKDAPIGFQNIRLSFDVKSTAPEEKIRKLVQLAERYCVIFQTLQNPPPIEITTNLLSVD